MDKVERILNRIKKEGNKLTELRTFLVSFLIKEKKPFSALELQVLIAENIKKVNKSTVYRELDFLLKNKIITEVEFGDGKKRYEIAGLPHHHHVICQSCEKVEDIVLENELAHIEKSMALNTSFKITDHSLEFFGLCHHCL